MPFEQRMQQAKGNPGSRKPDYEERTGKRVVGLNPLADLGGDYWRSDDIAFYSAFYYFLLGSICFSYI